MNNSLRATLLLGAATAAAVSLTSAARAQTETVVVTGSRIPQAGLEGASPVTTVSSQEVILEGASSIGNVLQGLPSVVNDGDNDSVNNGSGGLSTIDLRNLGTKRTLILVDGKRLVASDNSLDVDTNIIPAGMVDHVEVLTGGDSAVYGSDAVAGVVNIILKKDFEGLQANSQFSLTDHSDGLKSDSYVLLGFNSANGKGNVTIYGDYSHRDPVLGSARAFSAHALAATNYTGCASPATHFGGFCYSGSGTIPQGRIKTAALGGTDPATGLPLSGPTSECTATDPKTKVVSHVGCTTMFTTSGGLTKYNGSTFNFAPYQYLQTQGQRWSFGAEGHYQITKDIDFYTRLTFAENSTVDQLGPDPMTANAPINCGNPLMSVQERQTIFGTTNTTGTIAAQCATVDPSVLSNAANGNAGVTDPTRYNRLVSFALRLTAVGPRITANDHSTFQLVGGFKGDVGISDWSYDVSAQYGQTTATLNEYNDATKVGFLAGLQVDPNTGNCISGGTCIPINVFTAGGITQAQAQSVRINLVETSLVQQMDMQANLVGDLAEFGGTLPWAHDPIGFSIGAEYRQEAAAANPDNNLATDNLIGFSAIAPTKGEFDVAEGYGEVQIPVIQGMEFAKEVMLRGAYRFSAYDRAGDASTYRGSIEWAPTDDFKLRSSYDRAVRAPNVAELFTPAGSSSSNAGKDPCSAASNVTTTAALCIATGVPAGSVFSTSLNCPTNQCQGATGGNPFLKPEVATTREVGIVLTPTFLDGFTATIDYYDIKISGFIESTPLSTILGNCYSTTLNPTQSASNPYCSFVHRDVLGQIDTTDQGYVVQAEGNIGAEHVRGMDFEVNYVKDLADFGLGDIGSIAANYKSTWVQVNDSTFAGEPTVHCAGLYGTTCGSPQARYKSIMRATWADPAGDVSLSVNWRYISSVEFELNNPVFNPPPMGSTTVPFSNTPSLNMPAESYFDLSGIWVANDTLVFRAGVSNIFNQNPPLTDNNTVPASSIDNNVLTGAYDMLGRVFFVGATVKL